jgi:hypothetical protein
VPGEVPVEVDESDNEGNEYESGQDSLHGSR